MRKANTLQKTIVAFRRGLLRWFGSHQRDLPWRQTSDPYAIVVSEIMLQQTQVDRVIPKYHTFLQEFSTWQALAEAPQADVVRLWAGLGYNRRAIGLHKLAQEVVRLGALPSDPVELQRLPGIGPYTAQAIGAFAFRRKGSAPVDTNIERIIRRVFGEYEASKEEVAELARQLVPNDVWSWNHAMMDFGATVCTARSPQCETCPFQNICAAYPCDGNDIVKRPQGKFEHSDRWYRGKLVDHLRGASTVDKNDIAKTIDLLDKPRLTKIITKLVKDGLIIEKSGKLSLK